jgi:Uma2 family endonuclease
MRQAVHHYPLHQYLALSAGSDLRLEYLAGDIFAMAGGTPQHSALKVKVASQLERQLEGKPCRVYDSDLRVVVQATGLWTYPDASVVCGKLETDPNDANSATNPAVLVEVLSDSTEGYDRGSKFDHYKQILAFKEYVLVSHQERLIEVFRRGERDDWARFEARAHGAVRLDSIGCMLEVDRVYADLVL